MRVLLTTDTVGGVWTFTKELCARLLDQGHAVALVSLGGEPSSSQAAWAKTCQTRYEDLFFYVSLSCPLEWMEDNEQAYSAAADEVLRVACNFRAELLHLNQFCFGALPFAGPKLVTAHSDVLSWGESCCTEAFPESRWLRTYCGLVSAGLRGADALVAPTKWMADALCRSFPGTNQVDVIYNGRSLPDVSLQGPRRMQAITAGRLWDKAKGLAMLETLDAAMPVVVAGASQQLANGAEAGMLSEDMLLELFRQSSIYLAMSIYEPFGLTPLEAALSGCAVVANDIPSLREVWEDNAIFFRGSEELKKVLQQLAENAGVLKQARERSHARALQFSAATMVARYLDRYQALIEQHHAKQGDERMAYAG